MPRKKEHVRMPPKSLALALGLLVLAGCTTPVRRQVDALLCDRAAQPADHLLPAAEALPTDADKGKEAEKTEEAPGKETLFERRLKVPAGVPGSEAPPLKVPGKADLPALEATAKKYYPPLPPLGPEPTPEPGPQGRPLSLADLQSIARAKSPLLRQAASDIEGAKGAAVQAGLYPNPTIGTTGQTTGPGGGPFYGGMVSQTVKTMGKLKLAQAAAEMDLINAKLAYRRAETDLLAQVRSGYFAVLVARESMRANNALVQLTDEVYHVLVANVRGGGDVAFYEPMQLGALAAQARAGLLTARNSYQLAWRQLAAAMGWPEMPLTELEGRADMPIPRFDYQKALARVLANHTDVQTASYGIAKARYNLRLAQVTGYPDVNVSAVVQQDATPVFTSGPNRIITVLQMSVPVPIFDRNQGGIQQAQGTLLRASEEPHRVRADLTGRFADAFRRYDENRMLLELYRRDVLPKQVQTFRASVRRHNRGDPDKLGFTDLVQAEQNLVGFVGIYLSVLGAEWQAVVDVGNFLQTDQLFELADGDHPGAEVSLEQLLQLPCCHPCSKLGPPVFTPGSVTWTPSALTLGLSETAPPTGKRLPPSETMNEKDHPVLPAPRPARLLPIPSVRPAFGPVSVDPDQGTSGRK
jgi:cobalt-zinc-cadmium efflux system outer membrane protein